MRRRRDHKTDKLTLRLSKRLAALLDDAAAAADRTRSEFTRELLRRELLGRDDASEQR